MNLAVPTPPSYSGDMNRDIKSINDWCGKIYTYLSRMMCSIDDDNIISVSSDKIISDGE